MEGVRDIENEKGKEIEVLYLNYKETQNNLKKYENLLNYYKKIVQIEKKLMNWVKEVLLNSLKQKRTC